MTKPPAPARILETALYVSDLDEAVRFYGDVLGLKKVAQAPERHVFFQVGEGILLLFDPKASVIPTTNAKLPVPTHGATGQGHVCFAASFEEITARLAHFSALGIEIEADFQWPNGARSIYLRDPSGNSVEFAEPHLWDLS